jgi:phage terminase large subunit GpA-like protein
MRRAAEVKDGPRGRRDASLERFIVPPQARFLVAAVDVQGGKGARFVVQVHAVGPHLEQWPVDRFSIVDSAREDGDGVPALIDPAAYPEDWDQLTEQVIKSTYRLVDGRELRIRMIAVDTGGEDGVTDKAYDWFRRIRRAGNHVRVMLVKGASTKTAPVLRQTLVGAKKPKEPGDVPLYLVNPNLLKDGVAASLKRETPGPGYLHIPQWLPEAWFDELDAEIRRPDGTWHKVRKRNEAWDLCAYIRAAIISMGGDRINWEAPPPWARPLDTNSEVITADARRLLQEGRPAGAARRRVSRSNYLSGR